MKIIGFAKLLSLLLLILSASLAVCLISAFIISYNQRTIWLFTESGFRPGLSPEQIAESTAVYYKQILELKNVKSVSMVSMACCLAMMLWLAIKKKFTLKPFDALFIILITALFCILIEWLLMNFTVKYEEGHNATIDLGIYMQVFLLVAVPLILYLSYYTNNIEIKKGLHRQKWISLIALILFVLTGLIALSLGIALTFFVPELSGNIT